MNYTPTWNPPDPPQEEETKECPYCYSTDTEFILFEDEAHNTEIYRCKECKGTFTVEIDIPF